ncbi:hypothetical protein D3X12_24290 [Pseudomonas protegens]|jgi:hypothetical protein|uniref:Uncharacterized protein n=2 Tax=Pseudomonas protegens TaxID=380021 RepID=Q4KA43_PSEF5|nr:hypothetical protein [Pseudomonas protegens]AAY93054.1 conserved hypothetical protein [Pseudomonas protegens Pf-5]ASE22763.1 hypothetical protein CEP86_20645 [Pseudomonas protegens]QEZ53550.1 hypothetical protein D3X12_24290 [Pseudomonas protegens]QEZ60243.1 hypothetical protein D4N38_27525 [Pseudomonas protegens]QEZ64841.1 hypothetical protein D4N37_19620 [Pseudomonas protegens]
MSNYILVGAERQAELEAAKAAFFASGGQAIDLGTYRAAPPPARSSRVAPEAVLQRKHKGLSRTERKKLRKMAEAL